MMKITSDHLSRSACVYVRQSTPGQVQNNLESQRLQYGLTERAKQLGWNHVTVVDDDLGRSGNGVDRNGPRELDSAISEIFLGFQAAKSRRAWSKYTASGVRRSSAL